MSNQNDLARCRAEQARALANWRETGEWGALLGVSDWMLEEVVIMEQMKTRSSK